MKKSIPFLLVALAAGAHADGNYTASAKVIESSPIIETVYEEVEVCRYEYQQQRRRYGSRQGSDNTGDKVIGGIVGGTAGSFIGKGKGRDAAAGIGAVLGSKVADGDELNGGELIGAIAGGVIGNQIGKGKGKTAATAAGALIGSIVGDNLQNGNAPAGKTKIVKKKVRVCNLEERPKKIITGYQVTLEYNGFHFDEIVSKRPGETIDINVNVQVFEDRIGTTTY